MFGLHYTGEELRPVRDANGEQVQSRHARTMRRHARAYAAQLGLDVVVARHIDGAIRPAYIVTADGRQLPPPGAIVSPRERCVDGTGKTCFCSPCRARRKGERQRVAQEARSMLPGSMLL